MFEFKKYLGTVIPFIFGLIIGLSISGQWKWLAVIIPVYLATTAIIQVVMALVFKVKTPEMSTKEIVKEAATQTIEQAIDQTATGIKKGNSIYNVLISILVPIVTIGNLVLIFYLTKIQEYIFGAFAIISLVILMMIRDIRRRDNA
jgi:hypothetical protein